ncbi:MAG: retroviral-like aspartic protease family protein, partial [Bacteroidota bacterium]|nr:retroviral-like aspartic protease family protein [Bacteroidota bacterium]
MEKNACNRIKQQRSNTLLFVLLWQVMNGMGTVYAEIELINAGDLEMARRELMDSDEVKRMPVTMLVDSGAYNLCINETIQEQLDLPFIEKRKAQLANGHVEEYDIVGPVVVKFKNRRTVCNAMVLQGDSEPLLGSIPLEDMDVLIHSL